MQRIPLMWTICILRAKQTSAKLLDIQRASSSGAGSRENEGPLALS